MAAVVAVSSAASGVASIEASKQQLFGSAVRSSQASASSRKLSRFVVRATSSSDKPVKPQANRTLWFASESSLTYLDGSLPGDYGFDPLGLMNPEVGAGTWFTAKWMPYAEIINGRFAMLGAAGAIAPEIFGKIGLIPQETAIPWFKTGVIPPAGTYPYWADPYTLFFLEIALMGFAEHRRAQDYYKPGSMGKQYFLGFEKYLGGSGDPAYPGGIFNPLGLGKTEKGMRELKIKEVKNGRLAMLAVLGYFIQAIFTGVHSRVGFEARSPKVLVSAGSGVLNLLSKGGVLCRRGSQSCQDRLSGILCTYLQAGRLQASSSHH